MKQKISLVLSGGGARGNAHIGVIEELESQGYEIASVTGTSMGSLIGGMYADGALDAFKQWMVSLDRRRVFSLVDFTVGKSGVVKGDKVFKAMKQFIPDTMIEDLPIPYAAVAADLISEREVVFRQGSLFDAIRASVSIPSVLTPVRLGDMLLIDGGVLNNIPVNHAARVDGDLLVAVNVNARVPVYVPDISSEEDEKQKRAYRKKIDEFQAHLARIRPHLPQEKPTGEQYENYGYFDVVNRTISLATNNMAQKNLKMYSPDLLINVSRDSCGTYDFFKAVELVEAGRHATRQSLKSFGKEQS